MAKRLRVILEDFELRQIKRIALAWHLSIAEWGRRALQLARRREPVTGVNAKLAAIRKAVQYDFPSGDIEVVLSEIERGYGGGSQP